MKPQQRGCNKGKRVNEWVSEWVRVRQRLSHFSWHNVSSSCHGEREAWRGNWEEWKTLDPRPTVPITVIHVWQYNVFWWHVEIPWVWNGTRDPLFFSPSHTASSPIICSPKSFRFMITQSPFHFIQSLHFIRITTIDWFLTKFTQCLSMPICTIEQFQTIWTFEEGVQNEGSHHISVLTYCPVSDLFRKDTVTFWYGQALKVPPPPPQDQIFFNSCGKGEFLPCDFLFPFHFQCNHNTANICFVFSLNTFPNISFMAIQLHPNCTWSFMSTWLISLQENCFNLSFPIMIHFKFCVSFSLSSLASPLFLLFLCKSDMPISPLAFLSPCLCAFLSVSLIAFLPVCYCRMSACNVGGCSLIRQTAGSDTPSAISPASLAVFGHMCL